MPLNLSMGCLLSVLPLTREWIEMVIEMFTESNASVLPLTREWIEIDKVGNSLCC